MEITAQVRDYAARHGVTPDAAVASGMAEKAEEFRKTKEIYVAKPVE
jgi:hypothetical protein